VVLVVLDELVVVEVVTVVVPSGAHSIVVFFGVSVRLPNWSVTVDEGSVFGVIGPRAL